MLVTHNQDPGRATDAGMSVNQMRTEREREIDRGREIETDRQRQRQRQTDRQTDTGTETDTMIPSLYALLQLVLVTGEKKTTLKAH